MRGPDGDVGDQQWLARVADRSPAVRRSRSQSAKQAMAIVRAAQRLIESSGGNFTTQQLVKEAGVAMQTFYRYFGSKDKLLLAVFESAIAQTCDVLLEEASGLPSALDRLRYYVTNVTARAFDADERMTAYNQFVTSEHYRLHQLFADELAQVSDEQFSRLLIPDILEARDAGLLAPNDVDRDARYVTQLVMSTFHHHAFASRRDTPEEVAESLWAFCLKALGGSIETPAEPGASLRRRTTSR